MTKKETKYYYATQHSEIRKCTETSAYCTRLSAPDRTREKEKKPTADEKSAFRIENFCIIDNYLSLKLISLKLCTNL